MATFLIRPNGNVIMFDTAETVVRNMNNKAPEHPVENGSVITDHIIADPITIEITGFFSDAAFRLSIRDTFDLGPGRSNAILQELENMREGKEIFVLETHNEIFENVVLTNFRAPRDKDTGTAERVSMTIQQIKIVQRRFILLPKAVEPDKSAEEQKTGQQQVVPRDASALVQMIKSLVKSTQEVGKP